MIRSELVARIAAHNSHFYPEDVEAVISTILAWIVIVLIDGDRVELRDFATLATKKMRARSDRNLRTGRPVAVKAESSTPSAQVDLIRRMWVLARLGGYRLVE